MTIGLANFGLWLGGAVHTALLIFAFLRRQTNLSKPSDNSIYFRHGFSGNAMGYWIQGLDTKMSALAMVLFQRRAIALGYLYIARMTGLE